MATYLELKAQAEKLLYEAEIARQSEITEVIADIKMKLSLYGLTVQDLGLGDIPSKRHNASSQMKYRGPNGQEWGGGRGRKPDWVLAALKEGKKLEEFAI